MAETSKRNAGAPGSKLAEGADKGACDTAKMACGSAKTTADIREHMEVIASCGKHVGVVDHVEGRSLKLTKNDPAAAGKHHFIPMDWVATVDQHVHLNKNSEETFRDWKAEPAVSSA